MIRADQIPRDAWVEMALRLESCGAVVSDQVARLAAEALLNAWPGATTTSWFENSTRKAALNLPLPQESRDD